METISISSLKTNLSAILKQVVKGVHYTVLDRNQPIAEILPLPGSKLSIISPTVQRKSIKNKFKGNISQDPNEILRLDRSGNRF